MKNDRKKRLRLIYKYAKPHTATFLTSEVYLLIAHLIEVFIPITIAMFIDQVLSYSNITHLSNYIYLFILFFVVWNICWIFYPFIWQRLHNKFILKIKEDVFQKLIYAKVSYMVKMQSGDLLQRVENDTEEFINIIQRNVFHTINHIIGIILSLILIFLINIWLGILVIFSVIVPLLISHLLGKKLHNIGNEVRTEYGSFLSRLNEVMSGAAWVKLFSAERWAERFLIKKQIKLIRLGNTSSRKTFNIGLIKDLISTIFLLGIYAFSFYLIFNNKFTVGLFIAVIDYVGIVTNNSNNFISNLLLWQSRKNSVDRVQEILDIETEKEVVDKPDLIVRDVAIDFKNVSFSYDNENKVLENLNFTLESGQTVAIVGESGVGKTTLIGLILRFFDNYDGEINICYQNIQEINTRSLRKQIGYLQQDTVLLSGSIEYNLKLGKSNATDEELWNVIDAVGLREYIEQLPDELKTDISSEGFGISGGQRQRLGIARLLLRQPSIFILDEPTSSLDNTNEQLVMESIENIKNNNSIIIIISHKLSTIQNADKIIVMYKGRIISIGSHEELIRQCNYYTQLMGIKIVEETI